MTKNKKQKSKKSKSLSDIKITIDNKCDLCTGSICCTYITNAIDAPKTKKDFDFLLWQLAHKDVQLFKDDNNWYLSILTKCQHLKTNGDCAIYDKRPLICREHTNECCEYDGAAEDDFELHFDGYDALDQYCRERFKKWDKRFEKWAK